MALVVNSVSEFMKKVGENSGLNRIAVEHLGNATSQIVSDNAFAAEARAKLLEARKLQKAQKLQAAKAKAAGPDQKEQAPIQGLGTQKPPAAKAKDQGLNAKGYKGSPDKQIADMTPVLGAESAPQKAKKVVYKKEKSL
jgi:hypothetical protein